MVTTEQIQSFHQDGYTVARGLFRPEEVQFYMDHYMKLRQAGTYEGDLSGVDIGSQDPLKKYPRMIHMQRWDETSLHWMIDPRINACLTALIDVEPIGVQTMIYFKPPKARGQALHQDQYYLRVQPGTCVAAWLALDDCDEENGCLMVVPGSQSWPLLCTTEADTTQSFTDVTVPLPPGTQHQPVVMKAGDVMFFNGQLVHGSFPNRSENRFRRSLIGHYIGGDAQEVAKWYHPAIRMDGSVVSLGVSEGGGTCGVWVDERGKPVIEMTGIEGVTNRHE